MVVENFTSHSLLFEHIFPASTLSLKSHSQCLKKKLNERFPRGRQLLNRKLRTEKYVYKRINYKNNEQMFK